MGSGEQAVPYLFTDGPRGATTFYLVSRGNNLWLTEPYTLTVPVKALGQH